MGWIAQFYKTVIQKDKNINLYFPLLYLIGVLFLVIGNFLAKDIISGVLNLICAILALIIIIYLIKD